MSTMLFAIVALIACGGEAPPATPTVEPKVEAPKEEPKVEAPKEEKVDLAALPESERNAWLLKTGENVYTTGGSGGVACTTCHGPEGAGVPSAFPPLAGQKDMMGDCVHHAGLVVHGYSGEITVGGAKYNGQMPAQPTLTDEEIAAVISYERNTWGNNYGYCVPADVVAARAAPAPKL